MTNIYFLWVAIKICEIRSWPTALVGVDVGHFSEWLNELQSITLKNEVKIEETTDLGIIKNQSTSDGSTAFIAQLKSKVETFKCIYHSLTIKQKVALGLAGEEILVRQRLVKTDCLPREDFPEVIFGIDNILSKKWVFGEIKRRHGFLSSRNCSIELI